MNYIVQAVILVYFVGMFALGILGEQRTKNTADYYVAGRQVNGFFAGIVYTTSLVSAGALVGWVSQAWQWGIYFIYAASAVTVATFLCWWLLGRKLCTCSRDLNLFTVPDFLEKRFESRTARLIASLLIITFSIPLLVTQFAAIGILFNVTTGLSYSAAVICFGIIVFLYVSFGGYYAVVYTDVAQGLLILLGVIILLTASVHRVGPSPQLQYQQIFPHGFISWPGADSPITPSFLVAFITSMVTSSITFVVWNALGNPLGIYHIQMALLVSVPATLIATLLTPPPRTETLSPFFAPSKVP